MKTLNIKEVIFPNIIEDTCSYDIVNNSVREHYEVDMLEGLEDSKLDRTFQQHNTTLVQGC